MARMTIAPRYLLEALFLEAGDAVRVASAELIAADPATGELHLRVEGTGIPSGDAEVKPVFRLHRTGDGARTSVVFEPVEPRSQRIAEAKATLWPKWGR
jgi:hypothetical protein